MPLEDDETLAAGAAAMSWGLRRRHSWARWALIVLGTVPPLAMVIGIGLLVSSTGPAQREFGDIMIMPCVGMVVISASISAYWAALSHGGRAVLGPHYEGLVARTPKLSPRLTKGLLAGLVLACGLFILFWTLLFVFLSILAACGVIRSI